jgi:undecaprenyl-diphosphatase
MTLLQAILLGIIQGLTEFLPISSSAHLVLVPYLLGWDLPAEEAFIFDVLVQVASLVAVITFFWQDLRTILISALKSLVQRQPFANRDARLGWLLVLATIPAGLIGIAIKDLVEAAFANPRMVSAFLLITATLLVTAERIGLQKRDLEDMNWKDALWIGFAQTLAILPGISRSGATITGGMLRGFERTPAARFAFLMMVPIMLAAGLYATLDFFKIQDFGQQLPVLLPGLLASAIVSYISIRWLLKYLIRHSLYIFAIYCVILAVVSLGVGFFR